MRLHLSISNFAKVFLHDSKIMDEKLWNDDENTITIVEQYIYF